MVVKIVETCWCQESLRHALVLYLAKVGEVRGAFSQFAELNMSIKFYVQIELLSKVHFSKSGREHMCYLHCGIIALEETVLSRTRLLGHELHHKVHRQAC